MQTEKQLKAAGDLFLSGMNRRDKSGKVLTEAGKQNRLADIMEGTAATKEFPHIEITEANPEWVNFEDSDQ
jgi:hypothetical protein